MTKEFYSVGPWLALTFAVRVDVKLMGTGSKSDEMASMAVKGSLTFCWSAMIETFGTGPRKNWKDGEKFARIGFWWGSRGSEFEFRKRIIDGSFFARICSKKLYCCPGFKSQAHPLRFIVNFCTLLVLALIKRTKINNMSPGIYWKIIRNWLQLPVDTESWWALW